MNNEEMIALLAEAKATEDYLELLRKRELELVISIRLMLRKAGCFQLADEMRGKLKRLGIILSDTPQGTIWKYDGEDVLRLSA